MLPVLESGSTGAAYGTVSAADIEAGRKALARSAWQEGRARFERALKQEETGQAWEGLSDAAWSLCEGPMAFEAREHAYRLYLRQGDRRAASRAATWLALAYQNYRLTTASPMGGFFLPRLRRTPGLSSGERSWRSRRGSRRARWNWSKGSSGACCRWSGWRAGRVSSCSRARTPRSATALKWTLR